MWRLQSSVTILNTSPAWSAKRQLSGRMMAARPPGFRIVRTCWTKLSCLFEVADREVVPRRRLVRPLGPEGRIRQDDVEAVGGRRLVDGVAQLDRRLQPVEVEVHEGEAARPRDEVLAEVGLLLDALGDVPLQGAALGLAISHS